MADIAMKPGVTLQDFSTVIAAIQAASAFPERWLEAVLALARLLNPPEEHRFALASLDCISVGAFIVGPSRVVSDLNASARALLQHAGHVRIAASLLRFDPPGLHASFEEALRVATRKPARSSVLRFSATGREICEVAVSPLAGHPLRPSLYSMPSALVVIAPPRREEEKLLGLVGRRYGLTDAEARVMAELTAGATVSEIARGHGVQACTVRTQVRSIFEKTGVNRQSELVRLALTGAPR